MSKDNWLYFKKVIKFLKRPLEIWEGHDFSYRLTTRDKVDCYLVSMNQSGTHWLEVMIGKALVEHYNLDYEFEGVVAKGIIDDAQTPFAYSEQGVPRIQHSHFPYYFLFRGKKVILLVRDLRDSLVSRYEKHLKRRENPVDFSTFLREGFFNEENDYKYPLEQKVNFLNSWGKNKDKPERMLIVKYEELKENPEVVMKKVLNFMGISGVESDLVEKVVDFGSLENMKKLEGEQNQGNVVNKGKTGRHQDYFSPSDQRFFKGYVEENLSCNFGYEY